MAEIDRPGLEEIRAWADIALDNVLLILNDTGRYAPSLMATWEMCHP